MVVADYIEIRLSWVSNVINFHNVETKGLTNPQAWIPHQLRAGFSYPLFLWISLWAHWSYSAVSQPQWAFATKCTTFDEFWKLAIFQTDKKIKSAIVLILSKCYRLMSQLTHACVLNCRQAGCWRPVFRTEGGITAVENFQQLLGTIFNRWHNSLCHWSWQEGLSTLEL